jgi:hypothetical protein
MNSIKKVQDIVQHILQTEPDTRNSDDLLVTKVCGKINEDCLTLPFCVVMTNRKALGLPSLKSIDRSRRKLQRAYPELRANETVEAFRELEEEKYEAYGKRACL